MVERTIGDQELALLRYVSDREACTVGEVADDFGQGRDLARSTVLTMMERLRRKGYLTRRLVGGVYRYRACSSSAELLRGLVRRFVEKSLGGSVAPFVAYLNETREVSDQDLKELQELVSKLESERQRGNSMTALGFLTPASEALLDGLVRASVQGGFFVLIVWVACKLFRNLPAAIRCALWWLAALKLLVTLVCINPLPLPVLKHSVMAERAPAPSLPIFGPATRNSGSEAMRGRAASGTKQRSAASGVVWTWSTVAILVWMAVASVLLTALGGRIREIRAIARRAAAAPTTDRNLLPVCRIPSSDLAELPGFDFPGRSIPLWLSD